MYVDKHSSAFDFLHAVAYLAC